MSVSRINLPYDFSSLHIPVLFLQFRSAIQLQFDFHRAIYNLGTVLVSLLLISLGYHDHRKLCHWHCSLETLNFHSLFTHIGLNSSMD